MVLPTHTCASLHRHIDNIVKHWISGGMRSQLSQIKCVYLCLVICFYISIDVDWIAVTGIQHTFHIYYYYFICNMFLWATSRMTRNEKQLEILVRLLLYLPFVDCFFFFLFFFFVSFRDLFFFSFTYIHCWVESIRVWILCAWCSWPIFIKRTPISTRHTWHDDIGRIVFRGCCYFLRPLFSIYFTYIATVLCRLIALFAYHRWSFSFYLWITPCTIAHRNYILEWFNMEVDVIVQFLVKNSQVKF